MSVVFSGDSRAQAATTIDNFENLTTVAPWTAWKTSGIGTSASVSAVAGYSSTRALSLGYGFNCTTAGSSCGQYVAATLSLVAPVSPGAALSFMTRSAPEAQIAVRLIDQSGQTFQYRPARPPEGYDASVWYQAAVDLKKPENHWGGANNGVIQGQVKAIWIIAETRTGKAASGSVAVDDLAMLSAVPTATVAFVNGVATIDNFENRTTVAPWTAWKTSGIGTSASVSAVAGYSSTRALSLGYGFNCTTAGSSCGQYVAATLSLVAPVSPGAALSFMTRSAPETQIAVRLIDQSGQTFQYRPARAFDGYNPDVWYQAVVDLKKPENHWGGANNGVIQGQVKAIWIIVETRTGNAISNTVEVDDLAMLAMSPTEAPGSLANGLAKIDDFENRTTIAPWIFQSGDGLSSGYIASAPGFNGSRGISLAYNFACKDGKCGKYTYAYFLLPTAVDAGAAIRLRARTRAEVGFALRVQDSSGQTLQYSIPRPLEASDEANWYGVAIALSKPDNFWGGVNNGIVQSPIKAIAIVASNALGAAITGELSVDEIATIATLDAQYTLNPSATPLFTAPTTARNLGSRVGVAHLPSSAATPLDLAQSAGVKFVRTDMILDSIEDGGIYDFRAYDSLVDALEARDMGALFILREKYASPRYDIKTKSGIAIFARVTETIAKHYTGRNVRFEIWNEPDHPKFWSGIPNAADYAALALEATSAVHRGNPAAKVSTGGLTHFAFGYLEGQLVAGAARYADAIALHGYRGGSGPETLADSLAGAKSRIARLLGEEKPLWITEWGYSVDDIPGDGHSASFRQRQACLVSRQLLSQWALDVPTTTWYNLVDYGTDGANREQNFGLLDLQYSEKPALKALRMVTSTAKGRTYLGLVNDVPPGLHIMRLEDQTTIVFIAWNSQIGSSISLHLPTADLQQTSDFFGTAINGSPSALAPGYRIHTLTETSGPIFITYMKSP